jgi:hypothetical protein
MGTGRFGGGGSGALGRAGSGSGGGRAGGSQIGGDFFKWKATGAANPDPALARDLVRATLAQRNVATYVYTLTTSESVKGCYDDLVRFASLVGDHREWLEVKRVFGVADAPGCLAELLSTIEGRHSNSEIEAHREVAGSAVLDVLTAAVRGDEDVFLDGDAKAVLGKLDSDVLARLSGHYFGSVLHRALLRELPALNEREGPILRDAIQERANFIIDRFQEHFKKEGARHRDLLRVISENQSWFENQLRQEIEG